MNKSFDNIKWNFLPIANIIENINIAKSQDFGKLKKGKTIFIGRQETNNGIQGFVNAKISELSNCITIGMVGKPKAFWQSWNFATSQNILILRNKNFNKFSSQFICTILNKNVLTKYNYGKPIKLETFPEEKIMLPINSKGQPDYKFMKEYIKEKERKIKQQYKNFIQKRIEKIQTKVEINKKYKTFLISNIFETVQRGKRLIKDNQIKGKTPYISSTATNNGVDNFISNNKNVRKFKNCLSLANSGSVGTCFYQPFEFIASDHVTHLKGFFTKYTYLFLANMLNRLSEKYNFNREINDPRIQKEYILLPINTNKEPDYEYMHNYMLYLEQKKILEYLDFIK